MPLVADRVKELSTTTGTGTLTLTGAPTGFQTFSAAFGNGVSVYYVIDAGAAWEIGIGTTGAGTLSRDTVLQSTNGDALVDLAAGDKTVFCAYVADRAVTTSDAATLTNKTIDDYSNNVGANSTHFRIKANATLAKGDVVKADGFTPGEQAIQVIKVASSTDVALGIVEQALNSGDFGTAVVIGELFNVNTNGLAVGATLYSNGTGGFTTTKPSSGLFQSIGWVVRANSSTGVIAVNVVNPQYVEASTNTASTLVLRDGSGNFSAGTITAALTGNASTATTLANSRTLWGQSFNGSANVTGSLTSVGDITGTAGVTLTATSGTLALAATGANVITASTNGVSRLRVTSTGNVDLLAAAARFAWDVSGAFYNWIEADGVPNNNYIRFGVGNAEALRIITNGSVGIGTSSPSYLLSLGGNAARTVGMERHTTADTAGNNLTVLAGGATSGATDKNGGTLALSSGTATGSGSSIITFSTATAGAAGTADRAPAERMRIDGFGNVGIGVAPNAWDSNWKALQIGGLSAFVNNGSGNTTDIWHNTYVSTGPTPFYRTTAAASFYRLEGGTFKWFTAPSGTAGNAITFTQAMTLDASGNLKIGSTLGDYRVLAGRNAGGTQLAITSNYEPGSFASPLNLDIDFLGYANQVRARIRAVEQTTNSSTSHLAFFTSDATNTVNERARIDASGNVGIGVTPNAGWHLTSAIQLPGGISYSRYGFYRNAYIDTPGQERYIGTGTATRYEHTSTGSHLWKTAPSGTADNAITFTQVMTLDASGNLGIGTTSPSYLLSLGGNSARTVGMERHTTADTAGNNLTVLAGGATSGATDKNGGSLLLHSGTATGSGSSIIAFATATAGASGTTNRGATEKMRIDGDGNVGIGTNTPSALSARLVTAGSGDQNIILGHSDNVTGRTVTLRLTNTNSTFYTSGPYLQATQGTGLDNYSALSFGINTTERMRLDASGNVGIGVTPVNYAGSARVLHIDGGANASELRLTNNTTGTSSTNGGLVTQQGNNLYVWNVESSFLSFGTNNTERARIDASGNVGIGVTPSAWGGTYKVIQVGGQVLTGSVQQALQTQNAYYDGAAWRYIATAPANYIEVTDGEHRWYTAPSGTAGSAITFTRQMTLHASGGLSLGNTTDPGAGNLSVTGTMLATTAGANALTIGRQGATNPAFNVDASTASSATGLNVKAAAAAGGLAVSVLSSGTDENLTVDAKGSGTVTINGTATGAITLARNTNVTGNLSATGQLDGGYNDTTGSANTAAQALGSNTVSMVLISSNTTLTSTVPPAGAHASVIIKTSGNASRTVTFGTGFKSQGTLATGNTADRYWVVNFVSDGTFLYESSRTTTAYA